jgi:sulfatase maturation enzyme AslB (radical SAM superfamily)
MQVDIDLTNICNQDCFYCNSAEHRKNAPVQKDYREYIELLNKLASWRAHSPNSYGSLHSITFPGGGEPTLLKGYEKVVEHCIDLGFLSSITTNGYKLDKLINSVSVEKIQKMAWIGIDIDAGEEVLYERIRKTLSKKSIFNRVMKNASDLVKIGANVDFKVLLSDLNSTKDALENIFQKSQEVGVRMLYIRPAILNSVAYMITPSMIDTMNTLSEKYNVKLKINQSKYLERTYSRCHQMFQFPVFCADGYMYACCDNKGNERFKLGRWDEGDFRSDVWLSDHHKKLYDSINTHFCQPCRANLSNIKIQNIMDNTEYLEALYI